MRHTPWLAAAACLSLAACASGPKFADVQSTLPKPADDQARVWFYRTSLLGAAVQPSISLNGQKVADCVPNGISYRDVPRGDYETSTATEVERKLTFTVLGQDEKFIRCYISIGLFVGRANLELVDPAEARAEIATLHYVAPK